MLAGLQIGTRTHRLHLLLVNLAELSIREALHVLQVCKLVHANGLLLLLLLPLDLLLSLDLPLLLSALLLRRLLHLLKVDRHGRTSSSAGRCQLL